MHSSCESLIRFRCWRFAHGRIRTLFQSSSPRKKSRHSRTFASFKTRVYVRAASSIGRTSSGDKLWICRRLISRAARAPTFDSQFSSRQNVTRSHTQLQCDRRINERRGRWINAVNGARYHFFSCEPAPSDFKSDATERFTRPRYLRQLRTFIGLKERIAFLCRIKTFIPRSRFDRKSRDVTCNA